MSSPAILEEKKKVVAEISEKMKNAESFVIVDYKGITVDQVTELRARARQAGVEYKVYKNTFMKFAAKDCNYEELFPAFEGPSAIIFSNEDSIACAKIVYDFVKEKKLGILAFKGGVIEKKVEDVASISKIAQLPGKDVLIAKMLGSLNSPIANLAYVLNAIKDQKEATA